MSKAMVSWLRDHRASRSILTLIRVLIGFKFLTASLPKIGDTLWTGDHVGSALTGFIRHSLSLSQGPHAEVQGWYAWCLKSVVLPHTAFFSYLVPWGELLTGIALIVGCFTSFAALMGVMMNLSYLLAGVSSANPLMLVGGLFLLFGGWNAARWGVDYWVLPWCKKMTENVCSSSCKENNERVSM